MERIALKKIINEQAQQVTGAERN